MPRGRGGKRTPNNPAAVSGPGALSRRTDGGPGSDTQPIRQHPAEFHGQRQMLEGLQKAAPLPAASGGGPPAADGGGNPPVRPHPYAGSLFGPTSRPGEPVTAGAGLGPGPGPAPKPDATRQLLMAAYRQHPTEGLRRLIERSYGG